MDTHDELENPKDLIRRTFELNPVIRYIKQYPELENIYICGGCIRNILLSSKMGKDIDVFINCTKKDLDRFLLYLKPLGRIDYGQYGSPRVFINDGEKYLDIVPFFNFKVANVSITNIEDLLGNFDITANALAWHLGSGVLYNPVGGLLDIKNKLLRAVKLNFPHMQVSENVPLSTNTVFWFRLLHYQNILGFSFSSETEKWVYENGWRIKDYELFVHFFFKPSISNDLINSFKI